MCSVLAAMVSMIALQTVIGELQDQNNARLIVLARLKMEALQTICWCQACGPRDGHPRHRQARHNCDLWVKGEVTGAHEDDRW